MGEIDSPLRQAMQLQQTPGHALGWGRSSLGGEDVYGHAGGKAGYRSAVIFNPRTKTGVVVLTNARTDDSPMQLARHLLYRDSSLPPAPIQPKIVTLDHAALDAYAGKYRHESGKALTIARRRDHLLLDAHGNGVETLFPSSEDRFFSNTEDLQVVDTIEPAAAIVERFANALAQA